MTLQTPGKLTLYGREWPTNDPFIVERAIIRDYEGWKRAGVAKSLHHHYREAMSLLMPWFMWHLWSELLVENFVNENQVTLLGAGSTGKTYTMAAWAYVNFQIWTNDITILCSTTTRDLLNLRVFGDIKKVHKQAKELRPWLAGHITDANYSITVEEGIEGDGRDFKSGIKGVACKIGSDEWSGLSNYVGIKNKRLLLIMDELSLMGTGAIDAIDNLSTGGSDRFQCIGSGNPKDPLDPLGKLAEPVTGWDNLVQEKRTRTWRTRGGGVAIQLFGPDTPNVDGSFPGLIKPETIRNRIDFYGDENDIRIAMMLYGIMPRLTLGMRVLTMDFCTEKQAFETPIWSGKPRKRCAFLDPGKVVDGDRKILTFVEWGESADGLEVIRPEKQLSVPVVNSTTSVEKQIAVFCRSECQKRGIPATHFGFDSTGNATLASALAAEWSHEVVPVDFGGDAPDRPTRAGSNESEKQAYRNRVTGLWYAVRETINQRQVRGLTRDVAEEGCQRDYKICNKVGGIVQVQVEPKDEMKKRTKRSPDLMDSFAGAIEIARKHGFTIGRVLTTEGPKRNVWRDRSMEIRKMLRSKELERC